MERIVEERKWGAGAGHRDQSSFPSSGCRTPIDSRLRSTPVIEAAGDPPRSPCSIGPMCPGPRRKRKSTPSSITSVSTRHRADSCCRCRRTWPIGSIKRWVSSCLILYIGRFTAFSMLRWCERFGRGAMCACVLW